MMKVENRTRYDTRQLRRLYRWCLKQRGLPTTEGRVRRGYTLIVRYKRGNMYASGHAYVGGRTSWLNLPGPDNLQGRNSRITTLDTLDRNALGIVPIRPQSWKGPHGKAVRIAFRTASAARTILHELDHNIGLRHKDMGAAMDEVTRAAFDKAFADMPMLRILPPKVKPKHDVVVQRHARAVKHLANWQRKLKLAKGKVAKYTKDVGRYERTYPARIAAARKGD